GMRFVEYYFGLPLAMIVLCISFVPVFHRLKVYTAYEYLEQRFDLKTRALTSFLFLLQRGLSTGISIAAPSIILSSLLGWNIIWTNIIMGGVLIIYTVTGGARAVAHTQQLQMIIIFAGMLVAGYILVHRLPAGVGMSEVLHTGGRAGKLNIITTGFEGGKGFDWNDRYNLLSGIIGGFFLALSYFGTDQSQVGRYLTARSVSESRLGLLLNGLVKVPMQFLILLLGVLVFVFYQYNRRPLFFNQSQLARLERSRFRDSIRVLEANYAMQDKERLGLPNDDRGRLAKVGELQAGERTTVKRWIDTIGGDSNDTNYVFLRFVTDYLPVGLIGLLIAVIMLAAWGSIAAALNALASCTIVDFHRRFSRRVMLPEREYRLSRWYTLLWGIFCVFMAQVAYNAGNSLIEAVNVLGSLFYGVILGVFLVGFYCRKVGGHAVFISAAVVEAGVIALNILAKKGIVPLSFLWFNAVGAVGVILLSNGLQAIMRRRGPVPAVK
ncbi:MAG TPA: sodium:solute symporter, partial [Puia sp.]|nr:sodium:solute symporter [Puia sp.]